MSLFRREAMTHQNERLSGTINLAQPLSIKLTVTALLLISVSIIIFLCTAEYARKETVRGFLLPSEGVIKSFASRGGTIEKLWVKEGDKVEKNQPLVTLISRQNIAEGVDLGDTLHKQLQLQLDLLTEDIELFNLSKNQVEQSLINKRRALLSEKSSLQHQYTIALEKLALLKTQQTDIAALQESGFVSKLENNNYKYQRLEAEHQLQSLKRLLLQQSNQIDQVNFEIESLPHKNKARENEFSRQRAELTNRLAKIQSDYKYTITASHAGVITAIQIVEGESLTVSRAQSTPLLHILPKDSQLVGELLLPTRSAGFIAKGQSSRLRFDAFPFQRFGYVQGEVSRIDKALIRPNELNLPIASSDPVYRVRTTLNSQSISAYGQYFDLKSGMLFDADIYLERRSLMRWIFEPIYALKGRLS